MNKKIKQLGVGGLAVCVMLASFGLPVVGRAQGNQNSLLTVLVPDSSVKTLALDLQDGLDAQNLVEAQPSAGGKQTTALLNIEAKVKSFYQGATKKSGFETSGFALSAIADPIGTGVSWLKNNQNTQGSWGQNDRTAVVDTATVLSLFHYIAEPTSSLAYQKALDWFNLTYPENSGYLAEKTIALAEAGQDVVSLSEFLAGQINEQDLGFGYQRNYQSDIIITAKVLKAIAASNYIDPGSDSTYTLRSVLYYLLLSQNPDGGWPKTRGGQSDVKTTALVLQAFQPYQGLVLGGTPQGEIIIKTKIDLGLNYLKNVQSVSGNWQDIEGTARAYDIILNYSQYPNYNQAALDYLTSSQLADGSFGNQNSYLTANALKAIAKPDIAVTNIQNISATLPNQPTTAEITIANLGYFKSQPINFKAEPRAFHLIVDGQEIPLQYGADSPETILFSENSAMALDVILLNLAYGSHIVKFSVDYAGAEFDKINNQKSATLMFDNPVFTGPEPPFWAGAQTNTLPNKVTIIWKPSNNPATTHYYLFLGPSAGNYTQYFDIPSAYNMVTLSGFPDNTPYYFSVASVNAANARGDYSMETSARGYNIPNNYLGEIPFSAKDNNQALLYNVNFDLFGYGGLNSASYNPVFITIYPGNYYVTASKSQYTSDAKPVEVKPNISTSQVDFILPIIDNGSAPGAIQNLQAQPGNSQITLTWNTFNNSAGDFKNFNIYRSLAAIANVSSLTPINSSITNSSVVQFIDTTAVNGVDYYYAVTAQDLSGNQNPAVVDVGPVRGNSAPVIANISVSQDANGKAQISYDLTDKEQSTALIELECSLDGSVWKEATVAVGAGLQNTGAQKVITWTPSQDYPSSVGIAKIRITANDQQAVNNLAVLESANFPLDTSSTILTKLDFPVNIWRMLSLPLLPKTSDPEALLTPNLGVVLEDWLLARWDSLAAAYRYHKAAYSTSTGWSESNNQLPNFAPGLGYWLITNAGPFDISVQGTFVAQTTQTIALLPGWNQISNPFNYPINWAGSSIKIKNTATGEMADLGSDLATAWSDDFLLWWDGSNYQFFIAPEGQLEPWKGYFFHATIPCEMIISPDLQQTGSTGLMSSQNQSSEKNTQNYQSKKKESSEQTLQLSAFAGAFSQDVYNFAGLRAEAKKGYDKLDALEPPDIQGGVDLYFPHQDWASRSGNYIQDIRQPSAKKEIEEWYFEIKNTTGKQVVLKWMGVEQFENYKLVLVDLDANQTIDLYSNQQYIFDNSGLRHFRLVANPAGKARKK